jgi:hypothetical protein
MSALDSAPDTPVQTEEPKKASRFSRVTKAVSKAAAKASQHATNLQKSYCKSSEVPIVERLILTAARNTPEVLAAAGKTGAYTLDYHQVDDVKKAYKHAYGCNAEEDAFFDKIEARVVRDKEVSMQQLVDHLDGKSTYV